jgi:hypothetical protein
LTPFWIVPPGEWGPLGFGVTAHSLDDALTIIRAAGYDGFLPEDAGLLKVVKDVRFDDLPDYVRTHMGPIVVRGLWYPFVRMT